jgi:prepilin signal peptidase PulO-like enzyme (type II secretory pathway)
MTGLDYAAWFVLALLAVIAIGLVFYIGNFPGSVAKKRNHPNAEAIAMGSWAALLFGVILWPLVLMWAYSPNLFDDTGNANKEEEA